MVADRIGEAIKARREAIGLDIAQLAREAHVSRTTIHDLEEGRTKRSRRLGAIQRALEAAEAESGVVQMVPSETPDVERIEFKVEGAYGIQVIRASGPASTHETLREDVIKILRSIREGDEESPE